jgi:hypothetical protein
MFKVKELPPGSVEWLCKNRHEIDENPSYQRQGRVWSLKDKAFLIDSILNDYDIPKIYLADFTSNRSELNKLKRRYAVIDGKQRLEALNEFYDSKLSLDKGFEYSADPSLKLEGLTYKDLLREYPDLAKKFRDCKLAVMGVITDDAGKINDLFIRLNRSKPLVGAEIRNAMQGPVPPVIRKLATHKFFKSRINFETGRLQDQNTAAKMLMLEFRGRFVDTKKTQLDDFVKEFIEVGLMSQAKNFNEASQNCIKVLNDMVLVFRERDPLLRSQGPLTVYYWFVKEHAQKKIFIRPFLEEFDTLRKENKRRTKLQPQQPDLDTELLNFEILSRSTNDQASCSKRFAILDSRFSAYLGKNPAPDQLIQQIAMVDES